MKKLFIAVSDERTHLMVFNMLRGAHLVCGGQVRAYLPGSTADCICFYCSNGLFLSNLKMELSNYGLKIEEGENPCDPFQNDYVVDMMAAALEAISQEGEH